MSLAAAAGIIVALWISRPAPTALRVRKFTLARKGTCATPAISPDGKYLAYLESTPANEPSQSAGTAGARRLWVQDLRQEEPVEISDTQGAQEWPFWSPDSESIGFAARNHLWRVASPKGVPSPICEISDQFLGGAWSPDGNSIVFSINHQGIYEVSASGGRPKMLIPAAHDAPGDHFDNPSWLPTRDGSRILLYAMRRVGAIHDVVLHSLDLGRRTALIPGAVFAVYSATGHILYGQTAGGVDETMALPFSLKTLRIEGAAFPIIHNSVVPSVSRDGTLVFAVVDTWPRIQLAWHDRSGHLVERVGPADAIEAMSLSPDGRRIAFNLTQDSGGSGIWILDVSRGTKNRLTLSAQKDYHPIWAPTGKEITFCSSRLGHFDIYTIPVEGGHEPKLLIDGPLNKMPSSWSSDGRFLLYDIEDTKTGQDICYLRPKQGGGYESIPLLRTPANETSATFSPDGRFVAYVSDESGRPEVYIRRFPDGGELRQVSVSGGRLPSWRKNGKELFYVQGNTLMSVPVEARRVLTVGNARPLFQSANLAEVSLSAYFFADLMYAASQDGKDFIFPEIVGPLATPVIRVVENWFEEFRH